MAAFNFLSILFLGVILVTVASALTRDERDTVRILNGESTLQYTDIDNSTITTPSSANKIIHLAILILPFFSAICACIFS